MLIASLIFLATLILVIWQPRGLGIGWSAAAGAFTALLAGVIHTADIPAVWHIVWNATGTFVAIIIISLLLDKAGFFEWIALHVARWGQALLRDGDGIIGGETLKAMWVAVGPDPARGYGLGFQIETLDGFRSVGHGGAVYGYSTAFTLLPEVGLGVAVVTTLDFTGELAGRLARRALRLALASRGLTTGSRSLPMTQ